jgi:hypothetical protein
VSQEITNAANSWQDLLASQRTRSGACLQNEHHSCLTLVLQSLGEYGNWKSAKILNIKKLSAK